MKLSDSGLQFLKKLEECRLQTYRDAGGKLTIGFGHLLTPEELISGKFDDGITEQEALDLLAADVVPAEDAVSRYVKLNLFEHEFDALVCFVFNVGVGAFKESTLLKKLNAGNYIDVPGELRKWVKADGKRCQGLANRREKEILLWRGKL
jgi:lysozyme